MRTWASGRSPPAARRPDPECKGPPVAPFPCGAARDATLRPDTQPSSRPSRRAHLSGARAGRKAPNPRRREVPSSQLARISAAPRVCWRPSNPAPSSTPHQRKRPTPTPNTPYPPKRLYHQ